MSIYFSGSIAGGREKRDVYKELIIHCKQYGKVFNQCVGKDSIRNHKSMNIYERNMYWIENGDIFIAEVSVPSLGVGMEIERALNAQIPILCLYDVKAGKPTSRMITDCKSIKVVGYSKIDTAKQAITDFISDYQPEVVRIVELENAGQQEKSNYSVIATC